MAANPHSEALLTTLKEMLHLPETARPLLEAKASIQSAVAVTEFLAALTLAVNDVANRTIGRMNDLIKAIEAATAQAKESSAESSNLAKMLNRLTIWIALAALGSAAGTILQAVAAIRHW
jgi:hypothetical protein